LSPSFSTKIARVSSSIKTIEDSKPSALRPPPLEDRGHRLQRYRGLDRVENRLVGEAQQSPEGEWNKFSVDVATGAVRLEGV
jgi:hypothetical protein